MGGARGAVDRFQSSFLRDAFGSWLLFFIV